MKHNPAADITLGQQMLRGQLLNVNCPSRDVLRHMTSRWGVLVLIALAQGTLRFSELRRKVGGVSEKMLAQTLQWLEEDGLIIRQSFPVMPPHVEYRLSPLGHEVSPIVEALADWIENNISQILHSRRLTQDLSDTGASDRSPAAPPSS